MSSVESVWYPQQASCKSLINNSLSFFYVATRSLFSQFSSFYAAVSKLPLKELFFSWSNIFQCL